MIFRRRYRGAFGWVRRPSSGSLILISPFAHSGVAPVRGGGVLLWEFDSESQLLGFLTHRELDKVLPLTPRVGFLEPVRSRMSSPYVCLHRAGVLLPYLIPRDVSEPAFIEDMETALDTPEAYERRIRESAVNDHRLAPLVRLLDGKEIEALRTMDEDIVGAISGYRSAMA